MERASLSIVGSAGFEPIWVQGLAAPPLYQLIRSYLLNCLLRIETLGVLSNFQAFYSN